MLLFVCAEFNGAVPPNEPPLLPLPPAPVLAPGIPEPPYATLRSIQPFNVEAESIVLPGSATHKPAMVPVHLISNFDTDVRIN